MDHHRTLSTCRKTINGGSLEAKQLSSNSIPTTYKIHTSEQPFFLTYSSATYRNILVVFLKCQIITLPITILSSTQKIMSIKYYYFEAIKSQKEDLSFRIQFQAIKESWQQPGILPQRMMYRPYFEKHFPLKGNN